MNQRNRQQVSNGSRSSAAADKPASLLSRVGLRPVAILLMVAGAASFLLSRILFEDLVLCQFGSSLVTFAGLGLILAARRFGWGQPGGQDGFEGTDSPASKTGQVPLTDDTPDTWIEQPEQRPEYVIGQSLQEKTQAHFESLGAGVSVQASRLGRSILEIQAPGGANYTAIVLDSDSPADVPEVRALLALVNENGSAGGFLVAGGSFTQRAVQWTQGKPIQLVESGRLGRLRLD